MTREAAVKTLREEYCGEKFFCELHQDGLCSTEDCEIWWAINALENAKNDNLTPKSEKTERKTASKMQKSDVFGVKTGETCLDTISRQAAIRILDAAWVDGTEYQGYLHERFEKLPSTQPEVAKDTNVPINDCISRKAVKYKLTALVNELEEIFSHIRERNVDDSVCGLCEYDGAYIGQSGDWCNECPGFDKDDCFKLKGKYREEWLKIDG